MSSKTETKTRQLALFVLLAVFVASISLCKPVSATILFDPEARFATPTGTIAFLRGGSYEECRLENGSWYFQGLISGDTNSNVSQNQITADSPFIEDDDPWVLSLNNGTLLASTSGANVTVDNYDLITAMIHSGWFNYTVQGKGSQTWNFFYNGSVPPVTWNVIIDGVARAENDAWSVNDDGSLTVSGATSHVEIGYGQNTLIQEPPLPWTFQEYLIFSVAVGSAVATAVSVSILYFSGRRRKNQQKR